MGALAKNTALMTAAGVIMRCVGLSYQVWLADRVGASGMGLFQLIATVNMLCATLAISGIRFATTRLVSEEMGLGHRDNVGPVIRRCGTYALLFGFLAFVIMFFGGERVGFLWVRDARAVRSLQTLAFSMPMLALSSVFSGYFVATGRIWQMSLIQVAEQLINIGCAVFFLGRVVPGDLDGCCSAICRSNLAADGCSLTLAFITYLFLRPQSAASSGRLTARMLRIALPLAFSAYARVGLNTAMNLTVPVKLRQSGLSADSALSGYGIITGMVMPIITFPSCLLSAAAELSISELTGAQVQQDGVRIRQMVKTLLLSGGIFAAGVSGLMFFFAEILGVYIYGSLQAAGYIRLFALLVPIMYMDIITDGCLKGLGQMMNSMCYNICEAALGLSLVVALVPGLGLTGYIAVLFLCEGFNFTLSIRWLYKIVFKHKKAPA